MWIEKQTFLYSNSSIGGFKCIPDSLVLWFVSNDGQLGRDEITSQFLTLICYTHSKTFREWEDIIFRWREAAELYTHHNAQLIWNAYEAKLPFSDRNINFYLICNICKRGNLLHFKTSPIAISNSLI